LNDDGQAMSVTMLLAILDLASGEVRLVCAGHEDPIVVSAAGRASRIRLDGGPPFSVVDFDYPTETLTLAPGETLVLVTDGVTEAQNAESELFGNNRLLAGKALAGVSASAICDAIQAEVRRFEAGTEATDDLTVMVVRYLGA
jgi:sigma-B regulation protein RsbU (phosphoserine phosphatase)